MFHLIAGLVGDLTGYGKSGPHSGLRVANLYIMAGILLKARQALDLPTL